MGRRSFPGGIISGSEPSVSGSGASGMWTLQTHAQKITANTWPIRGVISIPSGPTVTISNVAVTDSSYNVLNDTPYVNSAGGYIKVTGTGFASGAVLYVGGSAAVTTSFINSTEVRAQIGAGPSNTFPVYVVNTDSSVAIKLAAITYSGSPSWSTAATLTSQVTDVSFSIALSATSDSSITSYTLDTGSSLPPGTTLYTNGVFAGTVTGLSVDTAYSFAVVANDAENQDASRTFTVTFSVGDQYFYLTSLLLNGDSTTWITDSSSNKVLPTITGDARPTAFSPYNTNWSAYFDGSGDYLAYTYNTTFGTGDFTVECWVCMPVVTNTYSSGIIGTTNYNGVDRGWALDIVGSNGYPRFYLYNSSGTGVTLTSSTVLPANRWTHLAAVRSGTTVTIYMNGVSIASGTNATNDNFSAPIYFGTIATSFALGVSGYSYAGYISNARIVVGVAVYTGAFTPPTSPLSSTQSSGSNIAAITGTSTSLLTLQDNRFKDNSSNAFAVTKSGDTVIKSFAPFIDTDTTTGSGYFDGTGDALHNSTAGVTNFSTDDFTVEYWVYPTVSTSTYVQHVGAATTAAGIAFGTGTSMGLYATTSTTPIGGNLTVVVNQWNHIAWTRQSGLLRGFLNGAVGYSASFTTSITETGTSIGAATNGSAYNLTGYLADIRVVKGSALYTTVFTPTAAPLSAVANTSLLTLQYRRGDNNHRFVDEAGVKAIVTRAGNAHQGTFSPFSPAGWSAYFDGTSTSYLNVVSNAAFAFGTGDFTLEAWIFLPSYPAAGTIAGQIISAHNWTGGTIDFGFRVGSAGTLYFEATGGANLTSTIVVPLGQWNHVACVRNSGTMTFYINGLSRGSASITTSIPSTVAISLGHSLTGGTYGALTGYISNARVVKGVAVYTGNFTPQTSSLSSTQSSGSNIAAITGTSTSLLTLQDNRFTDNSVNAFTFTSSGTKIQAFNPFRGSGTYSIATHGGSMYFDGSGDYISLASSPAMTLLTNTHTIEFWMYPDGTQTQYSVPWYYNSSTPYYFSVGSEAGGDMSLLVGPYSGSAWPLLITIGNTQYLKTLNNWTHVVITRTGTAFRLFLNGILRAYGTTAQSIAAQSSAFQIGWDGTNATTYYKGWLSGFRIINGSIPTAYQTAVTTTGTSVFTPPTSVPTFEANTVMQTSFTQGGIVDATGRVTFETVADAKIANVQSKFGTGSLYFDGTGDYLRGQIVPHYTFGTGDFTFECWIYMNSYNATWGSQILGGHTYGVAADYVWMVNTTGKIYFQITSSGAGAITSTSSVPLTTWTHIALVRASGTVTPYINGTSAGGAASYTTAMTISITPTIGADNTGNSGSFLNGYIDDLRISKYARYTSAFTVPSTAFLTK